MKLFKIIFCTSILLFFSVENAFSQEDKIFDKVEKSAHPIGGYGSFYKHVLENVTCKDKLAESAVICFIIEKDGNISNAKIIEGFPEDCGKTLLAFILGSGKWIPAKDEKQSVRQRVTIPIRHK